MFSVEKHLRDTLQEMLAAAHGICILQNSWQKLHVHPPVTFFRLVLLHLQLVNNGIYIGRSLQGAPPPLWKHSVFKISFPLRYKFYLFPVRDNFSLPWTQMEIDQNLWHIHRHNAKLKEWRVCRHGEEGTERTAGSHICCALQSRTYDKLVSVAAETSPLYT